MSLQAIRFIRDSHVKNIFSTSSVKQNCEVLYRYIERNRIEGGQSIATSGLISGLRLTNTLELSVQLYLHILMCVYLPDLPTGQKLFSTLRGDS